MTVRQPYIKLRANKQIESLLFVLFLENMGPLTLKAVGCFQGYFLRPFSKHV